VRSNHHVETADLLPSSSLGGMKLTVQDRGCDLQPILVRLRFQENVTE
jgi:hypothetical protein